MSVERIRALEALWLQDAILQTTLNVALDAVGFTDDYVANALASARAGTASRRTKYIKDNVWGMIRAHWRTMRLIDSPVMQRLRGIRQLGLSYLVYPTAEHTRFVHSIGMAHLVSELLDEAGKRLVDDEEADLAIPYVTEAQFRPLRRDEIVFAAVLHDVGHMPFSHATETILSNRPESFLCGGRPVAQTLNKVGRALGKKLGLAEILSLIVILSPRFRTFYDGYVAHGFDDPDSLRRVAALIAGLPPEGHLTGVADVISAATVDADKIDYISRDAMACGIPVGLDVSRTLLRCGFVNVTREKMRAYDLKTDPAEHELIFIVNASGMDTVDEITQARASLYQRVYLHGVTRTAEAVLSKILELNVANTAGLEDAKDALRLWAIDDAVLLDRFVKSPIPEVRRLADGLHNRELPKKACVFSPSLAGSHMPLDGLFRGRIPTSHASFLAKQVAQTRLESLRRDDMLSASGERLEAEIRAECERVEGALRAQGRTDLIPGQPLHTLVVIGTAYMDRVRKDGIVLQNGELLRTSRFTNAREQQDAFDIFKAVGYVMCDAAWRAIALVAARTILAKPDPDLAPTSLRESAAGRDESPDADDAISFQARMILDLEGTIRRAGLRKSDVYAIMDALAQGGYFDAAPHLARRTDIGDRTVNEIAARLAQFEGQRTWSVTPGTVAAFIDQFPPRLRPALRERLAAITVFDTRHLAASLLPRLLELSGGRPCDVVALSPNSGNRARQALETEAKGQSRYETLRFHKDVPAGLRESTDAPLILIDDNLSSGTQARAQFLAWFGRDRETWPEACRPEDGITTTPLAPAERDNLKRRPVHIVVCAGRSEAGPDLAAFLADLGVGGFGGLHVTQEIAGGTHWDTDLETYLRHVGLHLNAWAEARLPPSEVTEDVRARCEQRAFGYGNHGALVTTTDSVPTATVTALWCPGVVEGRPWMPLLLRRNKLRHFVLS